MASPRPGCASPLRTAAAGPAWGWPCSAGQRGLRTCPVPGRSPAPLLGGACVRVAVAGRMQTHGVTAGTALGSRRDGAARVPSAITNSSCSGHVFAFACLIFSTPFATLLPAPSLHLSLLFPILPPFFSFVSFHSVPPACREQPPEGTELWDPQASGQPAEEPLGAHLAAGRLGGSVQVHATTRRGQGRAWEGAEPTCATRPARTAGRKPTMPGDQPCSPAPGRHRGRACPGSCLGCHTWTQGPCCPIPVVRDAGGSQTRLALLPGGCRAPQVLPVRLGGQLEMDDVLALCHVVARGGHQALPPAPLVPAVPDNAALSHVGTSLCLLV